MKLFLSLLAALALPTAVNAEKLCTITSELDKDVVIKIEGDSLGMSGRITYKEKPMYRISFFHQKMFCVLKSYLHRGIWKNIQVKIMSNILVFCPKILKKLFNSI